MHRHVPFDGNQEELDQRLTRAARSLGLRITGDTIASGCYLASHPDEMPWSAQVALEDSCIVIKGITRGAPWSRAKRERILTLRLDELSACLAGETTTRQTLATIPAGTKGVCSLLMWGAGYTTAAIIAAMVPLLAAGMVLVGNVVRTLGTRAQTLERIGAIPLPSMAELSAIDGTFLLGTALVLMLPVAFLVGFTTALVYIVGDLFQVVSRWTAILLLPLWALLLAGFWSAMGPVLGTLFTTATAGLTVLVLSFLWSRRKEVLTRLKFSLGHLTLLPLLLIALLVFLVIGSGSRQDHVRSFRDRVLLPTAPGRRAATFYYRHTLYAAETYKPSFSNPFTATLRDPGFLRTALTTEQKLPLHVLGIVPEVCSPEGARAELGKNRHDFYVLPDSTEWRDAVRDEGLDGRAIFVRGAMTAEELALRLETRNSEATELRALTAAGWNALLFGGPIYLLWVILALAGLIGNRFPHAAPALLIAAQLLPAVAVLAASLATADVWATRDQEQLALFLRAPDPRVRAAAASRTARLLLRVPERRPELHEAIVDAVHDEETGVRTWAVLALARYGDEEAVQELISCLHDDTLLVRYRAAAALRELSTPLARSHLEERMREDAWYVGMYSLAAIRNLDAQKR